jgi:pyridoxal phosphate phosphatase PHOSPHO2
MARTIIWDFDWSLVNENTDTWVFLEQPGGDEEWAYLKERCRQGVQWTRLMDEMLLRHWERGRTVADLVAALCCIPIFPEHIEAVRIARCWYLFMRNLPRNGLCEFVCRRHRRAGARQFIVSDANSFYIDVILQHHGISDCFDGVFTNPAEVITVGASTASQRLTVAPFQPWDTPHDCKLCSVNICKGAHNVQVVHWPAPSEPLILCALSQAVLWTAS